jgi:hypothetical protein
MAYDGGRRLLRRRAGPIAFQLQFQHALDYAWGDPFKEELDLSMRIGMAIGCMVASIVLIGAGIAAAEGPAYGPAGCGLGNMIIGGGHGFSQVFASTTNATSASQTFGITSGTSNCNMHGTEGQARSFIENNREVLAKEMSRGRGETVATLSRIAGCADPSAVGSTLQSEYRSVFPDASVSDASVSERIVDLLRDDEALACQSLG